MDTSVRPRVLKPTIYGGLSPHEQWHEYPSGLIDLSRPSSGISTSPAGPELGEGCFELVVEGGRRVRLRAELAAVLVVDMQNFFLMPELNEHPEGLKVVEPILRVVRHLRPMGARVVWLNWGLDDTPLPAAMDRDFKLTGPPGGLGAELGNGLGRVLFKGERNTQMFPPLQEEYERNKEVDKWVDKDRMSGLWGRGGELERELESGGRRTLVVLGINADQCVSSTIVDAFALGYDVIALRDCIATTSPGEAKDQIMFNMLHEYGFVTDSEMVGRTSLA